MNGKFELLAGLRADLLKDLREAYSQYKSGNLEVASRILRGNKWVLSRDHAGHMFRAWRTLGSCVRRELADNYLYAAIPREFHNFSPALYPSTRSLTKALGAPFPCGFDDSGNPISGIFKGGYLLYGPTGAGKTRAAFRMLTRWIREDGSVRFNYVSALELKRRFNDAVKSGDGQELIAELTDSEDSVLFIDDLSQVRMTDSFAENLFELINTAYISHFPLIVTVQTSGDSLAKKWCADSPKSHQSVFAIIRRLKEYCTGIAFERD